MAQLKPRGVVFVSEARTWIEKMEEKTKKKETKDVIIACLFTGKETVVRTWDIKESDKGREIGKKEEYTVKKENSKSLIDFNDIIRTNDDVNYIY